MRYPRSPAPISALLLLALAVELLGCGPTEQYWATGVVYRTFLDGTRRRQSDAIIRFLRKGSVVYQATADQNGQYRIELPASTYAVSVTDSQGIDWGVGPGHVEIKSSPETSPTTYTINIELGDAWLAAGNVSGYACRILSNQEYTVADVEITFIKGDGRPANKTTAGSCGEYRLTLGTDKYQVHATHPDYADYLTAPGAFTVAGSGSQGYNIRLDRIVDYSAPNSTWQVTWQAGKPVTEDRDLRLQDYRNSVVVLYIAAIGDEF